MAESKPGMPSVVVPLKALKAQSTSKTCELFLKKIQNFFMSVFFSQCFLLILRRETDRAAEMIFFHSFAFWAVLDWFILFLATSGEGFVDLK